MLNDNNEPQEVNLKELVQGKKVVIFGLPGEVVLWQQLGCKGPCVWGGWELAQGKKVVIFGLPGE
jgi:peroxiredoxin